QTCALPISIRPHPVFHHCLRATMLSSWLRAASMQRARRAKHGATTMATVSEVASHGPGHHNPMPADEREGMLARLGLRFTNWAEHWFPDAYVFVCLAVAVVAVA